MNRLRGITPPSRARALILVVVALVACATLAFASPAFAATYDPLNVIPYDTWRASNSMSVADIQSFLEAQSGPLGSVVTSDYAGITKPASQIIWEAARGWNLNPKVILVTLQKEQSLITTSNSSNAARLVKAMGCGVYGTDPVTGKTINRYPGFGKQIWNGARVLSTYEITYSWFPGKTKTVTAYKSVAATKTVDGKVVVYQKTIAYDKMIVPANASTFALYTYTPYYPQKLVWDVYVRYFGDPQTPPRLRPVYRFKNTATGALFYTVSEGARYNLASDPKHTWAYDCVSFTVDSSSTANTATLYRLENTKTHTYYYTPTAAKRDSLLAIRPIVWRLSGSVGRVSEHSAPGAAPVYRLENKRTHGQLLTVNLSTKASLTTGRSPSYWYRGISFYLGRSTPTTAPVGP